MKLSKLFGFCLNETAMETFDNMGWLRSNKGEKKIKGAFKTNTTIIVRAGAVCALKDSRILTTVGTLKTFRYETRSYHHRYP
jgi:hypothetical protein